MDLTKPGSKGRSIRPGRLVLLLVAFFGLLLFYLTGALYFKTLSGADASGCRKVYMFPSYARIKSFDETHTKFASKYSLYLYREQNKDPIPNEDNQSLNGIPILFIPGNAGSYRQVRSIASETSNLYFDDNFSNVNSKNFDFFSADFNEDFTAFHGRTILDQAEYLNQAIKFILQLYENNVNPPKSVIILAHSMGGVVARVMVTLPNYVPESINTIITLASPHAAAPLTFDGDILKIYSAIDRFWLAGYQDKLENDDGSGKSGNDKELNNIAMERLANLSLVSITGGLLDTILPADYTTLGYLVPPSNGFTVYTTGIQNVWTPVDHLAIVWCGQLRRKISELLLDIADYESPYKTLPLSKRMLKMKKKLLTGFEEYLIPELTGNPQQQQDKINIKLDTQITQSTKKNGDNVLKFNPGHKNEFFHLIHLNKKTDSKFSLLSTVGFNSWSRFQSEQNNNPSILLCNNQDKSKKNEPVQGLIYDYTNELTQEYVALECIDVASDTVSVPRSHNSINKLSDSSLDGDHRPFTSIQYDQLILKNYDLILIGESSGNDDLIKDENFLIAESSEAKSTEYTLDSSLFLLFTTGNDISLSAKRPLSVNVKIPGAWSSLLAYKVEIKYHKGGREGETPEQEERTNFEPFIRQWSIEPYESKWHINILDKPKKSLIMTMHGIAPFTPFKTSVSHNMNLEIWNDSTENKDGELPLDVRVLIELFTSLRLLVLRYRLGVVAFGLIISLMVFLIQLIIYHKSHRWMSYVQGLQMCCKPIVLIGTFIILGVLGSIVNTDIVAVILNMIDPVVIQDPNEINISLHRQFKMNSFYLGLEEYGTLWFLGIIFYLMSIGINLVLYYIVDMIGQMMTKMLSWINFLESTGGGGLKRRIASTIIIILLLTFFLPFQFGYLVSVIVQVMSVIRLGKKEENYYNYQVSLLMMMLWILPINIPILIVFIHNFTVNWKTPFLSHHNFLAIIPILIMVERNSYMRGKLLPGKLTGWKNKISYGIIIYFICYSLIYGIRHTYWLHHLFNCMSSWILFLYYID